MAKFSWSLALVMALCLGNVILAANETDVVPETTDPGPDTNTTTRGTTTTTPTTAPTTTTMTPTTITPNTTTPTTTTAAPTPTTSRPTTPPKPTAEWPYNIGDWNYTDVTKNVTCIRIRGAFELHFPYNATVKFNETAHSTETKYGFVLVPQDREVNVSGNCDKDKQWIKLQWLSPDANVTAKDVNYLQFNFAIHTNGSKITDGKFALESVEYMVTLTNQSFPNATASSVTYSIKNLDKDQAPLHKSYKCLAKRTLKNDDGAQELKVASSQFEAFRNATDNNFGPSEECDLDGVTDIVPIAVGASLAGLVVVVLIAYLIGRRRSRARGYQSV